MKVFVTGGNGFLGSRTVHELVRKGYEVRCLLRATSKTERIRGLSYETHLGDILDQKSLLSGAQGCDAIIHLACISSWTQIRAQANRLEEIAVEGTRNVLEAALQNKIPRTLHVSSSVAINASTEPVIFDEHSKYELQDSGLHYSIAKFRAEQVVREYADVRGLNVTTVNPCEIYGPNDEDLVTASNLLAVLKGSPSLVCHGGTSVAHVDDIARGIVLALEKGKKGERYILGGENLSVAELSRLVRQIAGKNPRTWILPNGILKFLCNGMSLLGLPPPVPLDILDYAVLYWFVDSSKAKHELGYTARPAQETFTDVVRWLKDTRRIS